MSASSSYPIVQAASYGYPNTVQDAGSSLSYGDGPVPVDDSAVTTDYGAVSQYGGYGNTYQNVSVSVSNLATNGVLTAVLVRLPLPTSAPGAALPASNVIYSVDVSSGSTQSMIVSYGTGLVVRGATTAYSSGMLGAPGQTYQTCYNLFPFSSIGEYSGSNITLRGSACYNRTQVNGRLACSGSTTLTYTGFTSAPIPLYCFVNAPTSQCVASGCGATPTPPIAPNTVNPTYAGVYYDAYRAAEHLVPTTGVAYAASNTNGTAYGTSYGTAYGTLN